MVSAATDARTEHSTFGNWQRPASPGLFGLGLLGTVAGLVGFMVGIVLMLVWWVAAVLWLLLLLLVLAPLTVRRDGMSGWERLTARLLWWRGRRQRRHLYRSGIVGLLPTGRHLLPGVAAQTELLDQEDAYGERFGLVRVPSTGHYSIAIRCDPDGEALVDQSQVESWVGAWAGWLSSLAHESGLAGCAVTVETSPDPGTSLRTAVRRGTRDDAPDLARRMMAEIEEDYPEGSSMVRTWVMLTYRASGPGGVKQAEEMVVELGSRGRALADSLRVTGAGTSPRLMTAAELAETVRVAYDPAAARTMQEAREELTGPVVDWADVGPVSAQEHWDHYVHDSGISMSWLMSEAPRGLVLSSVLTPLLAPSTKISRKRVTLLYRPHDPGETSQLVQADVRTAQWLATSRRQGTARADLALRQALKSEQEEAAGAALLRFSMLVTATVTDPARRADAEDAMARLSGRSKLRLRPAYGAQALVFAANLPTGLILPEHSQVPALIREGLR